MKWILCSLDAIQFDFLSWAVFLISIHVLYKDWSVKSSSYITHIWCVTSYILRQFLSPIEFQWFQRSGCKVNNIHNPKTSKFVLNQMFTKRFDIFKLIFLCSNLKCEMKKFVYSISEQREHRGNCAWINSVAEWLKIANWSITRIFICNSICYNRIY